MIGTLLQVAFLQLFPALVIFGAKRLKVLEIISPVVLCYVAGLLLANLPFLTIDQKLSMSLSEGCVGLAIPLLLFGSDFLGWLRTAKKAVLSFVLCIVAVMISSFAAAQLFGDQHQESWKLAGMMVGVYTGGTPNMSAIGLSLGVQEETFILLNAADVVMGGAYLVFLLSVAQRVLLRFLPAYRSAKTETETTAQPEEVFRALPMARKLRNIAAAGGIALLILAAAAGLSFLISGKLTVVVVVLTVTTAAIAASFVGPIHRLTGSHQAGDYLLLVFCVSIGSVANIAQMLQSSSFVFSFVGFVMFSAILIHYALAFLFRIDADTVLSTSAAGIYGPAFAGPVASALKNKEVLITGLTTGLVGYAVGNYLGLGLAYLLSP